MNAADVPAYLASVPVYRRMREDYQLGSNDEFGTRMLEELLAAKAVKIEDGAVMPTMRV